MLCEKHNQKQGNLSFRDILFDGDNWETYIAENDPPFYIIEPVEKLRECRTGKLGYHYWYCEKCGFGGKTPHSCKSKLCSSCATVATQNWLAEILPTLLDVKYFQIVFTLPPALYPVFTANKKTLYNLFFKTASQAILLAAKASGFEPGAAAVFHPFGAEYNVHPHIHFMATAGGLISSRRGWFTLKWWPLELTRDTFKALLYKEIRKLLKNGQLVNPYGSKDKFEAILQALYPRDWNLFIGFKEGIKKARFGLSYISRYAKRAIISDRKLIKYDGQDVTFQAKNKTITINKQVFIKSVLRHVMPKYFKTTRFYGIYANKKRKKLVALAKELSGADTVESSPKQSWVERRESYRGKDPLLCPICGNKLTLIEVTHSARVPQKWDGVLTLSTFDHFL